ncbi:MAG: maltokinase N-terminal cap-like domain-containing protein [Nocardioidaceae bacterium]
MIPALEQLLASARWFGGKGRGVTVTDVRRVAELGDLTEGGPLVAVLLVEVAYDDGATETYQVPLSYYREPQERLAHAVVGDWDEGSEGHVHAYDAVHDRESGDLYLRAFADQARAGALVFHRVPGYDLDLDAHSTLMPVEQSNSSLAFGEDSLMKLFRKVMPGTNPDIEIHEALTRAGSENVALLYGWLELTSRGGPPTQLALLQQFLRTASDGWDLALASVRDLFAEADLRADEVGGDFAGESERLGEATALVHATLAEAFPTEIWGGAELTALADDMRARLEVARAVVPGLAELSAGLLATFGGLTRIGGKVEVQRVHGDLHLGQTLRTVKGWKIVDFEGEPAKPLAERVRPDSPWRDVAGMLRSFDYASHSVQADVDTDDEARAQIEYRATEWAQRNQVAFLRGYTGDHPLSSDEALLLRAYEADKAVYEAVYEARNRPTWLHIPLGAIGRLVA